MDRNGMDRTREDLNNYNINKMADRTRKGKKWHIQQQQQQQRRFMEGYSLEKEH